MTRVVVLADTHIRRTGTRRLPDAAYAHLDRAGRMRRRFPEDDVVVFGHSYIPWDDAGVDGQLLFNPGSPTERRAQPNPTLGTLDIGGGRVVSRIHVLG